MRILILGASGMLGHKAFQVLLQMPDWTTFGTIRSARYLLFFPDYLKSRLIESIDVLQNREPVAAAVLVWGWILKQVSSLDRRLIPLTHKRRLSIDPLDILTLFFPLPLTPSYSVLLASLHSLRFPSFSLYLYINS